MSRQQSIRKKSIVYSLASKVFPRRKAAAGFTLLEMLVVVAILMLLAGLILAAINAARDRAKHLKVKQAVVQLKTALDAYYADYSGFPHITEENSILGPYYVTGQELIQTLRGRENYNNQNPRRISYMDFHRDTETFKDPWGNLYRVSFDDDYNGSVVIPGGVQPVSVAAWSAGEDGQDGTDDDIKTWR